MLTTYSRRQPISDVNLVPKIPKSELLSTVKTSNNHLFNLTYFVNKLSANEQTKLMMSNEK